MNKTFIRSKYLMVCSQWYLFLSAQNTPIFTVWVSQFCNLEPLGNSESKEHTKTYFEIPNPENQRLIVMS